MSVNEWLKRKFGLRYGAARPGEGCKAEPGRYVPIVNRNRCEGKSACVSMCPYGVFEVQIISDADFSALSWMGKLKSFSHGRKTAYTPNSNRCLACGFCVTACPEKAITLKRLGV